MNQLTGQMPKHRMAGISMFKNKTTKELSEIYPNIPKQPCEVCLKPTATDYNRHEECCRLSYGHDYDKGTCLECGQTRIWAYDEDYDNG